MGLFDKIRDLGDKANDATNAAGFQITAPGR
ncbi:hypothetical protein ABH920_007965 [Catenulispora sp. EB89]